MKNRDGRHQQELEAWPWFGSRRRMPTRLYKMQDDRRGQFDEEWEMETLKERLDTYHRWECTGSWCSHPSSQGGRGRPGWDGSLKSGDGYEAYYGMAIVIFRHLDIEASEDGERRRERRPWEASLGRRSRSGNGTNTNLENIKWNSITFCRGQWLFMVRKQSLEGQRLSSRGWVEKLEETVSAKQLIFCFKRQLQRRQFISGVN